MDETQALLMRCFAAVFPSLTSDDILQANTANVQGWDSVASVTLFAMIEEEFGIEMDLQDLTEMVSFERILAYLNNREAGREFR